MNKDTLWNSGSSTNTDMYNTKNINNQINDIVIYILTLVAHEALIQEVFIIFKRFPKIPENLICT